MNKKRVRLVEGCSDAVLNLFADSNNGWLWVEELPYTDDEYMVYNPEYGKNMYVDCYREDKEMFVDFPITMRSSI